MKTQFVVTIERLADLLHELAVSIHAGNFIFVLVGHQFGEVPRDRFGKSREARTTRLIRLGDLADGSFIAVCVGTVLVLREQVTAVLDDVFQVGQRLHERNDRCSRAGCCLDTVDVKGGHAAPLEAFLVHGDGHAIQFDGAHQRFFANRELTALERGQA